MTQTREQMTDERATEIFERYDDYEHIEDALLGGTSRSTPAEERKELAAALAFNWRETSDDPGFNQPGNMLVQEVEDIIGEPVWRGEATPNAIAIASQVLRSFSAHWEAARSLTFLSDDGQEREFTWFDSHPDPEDETRMIVEYGIDDGTRWRTEIGVTEVTTEEVSA
jgi:hypothetical protein